MMKGFLLISFFCALNFIAHNKEDDILGKWMSAAENIEVEVFRQDDEFKARILWFDDTDDITRPMAERMDEKNRDKSLRSRKILGIEVLNKLRYDKEDDEWQGGIIYDSRTGKEWNAKAWINKEGLLTVRGYWRLSIFGQNMTFKRVN